MDLWKLFGFGNQIKREFARLFLTKNSLIWNITYNFWIPATNLEHIAMKHIHKYELEEYTPAIVR